MVIAGFFGDAQSIGTKLYNKERYSSRDLISKLLLVCYSNGSLFRCPVPMYWESE